LPLLQQDFSHRELGNHQYLYCHGLDIFSVYNWDLHCDGRPIYWGCLILLHLISLIEANVIYINPMKHFLLFQRVMSGRRGAIGKRRDGQE
jgi:hypothetical protein